MRIGLDGNLVPWSTKHLSLIDCNTFMTTDFLVLTITSDYHLVFKVVFLSNIIAYLRKLKFVYD